MKYKHVSRNKNMFLIWSTKPHIVRMGTWLELHNIKQYNLGLCEVSRPPHTSAYDLSIEFQQVLPTAVKYLRAAAPISFITYFKSYTHMYKMNEQKQYL